MSTPRGPCADFQLRLIISGNSIVNINKAKTLRKSRKQFASRRNRSSRQGPGVIYIYTYPLYTGMCAKKIMNNFVGIFSIILIHKIGDQYLEQILN